MDELIKFLKDHIKLCDELQNMKSEQKVLQLVLNKAEELAIKVTHSSAQLISQFEKGDTVVVEGEILAKVLEVYKHVVKVEISDGTTGKIHKDDLIIVKKAI